MGGEQPSVDLAANRLVARPQNNVAGQADRGQRRKSRDQRAGSREGADGFEETVDRKMRARRCSG